jgi:hypothetical protein
MHVGPNSDFLLIPTYTLRGMHDDGDTDVKGGGSFGEENLPVSRWMRPKKMNPKVV